MEESLALSRDFLSRTTNLWRRQSPHAVDEWLGAESHVPNLGHALRLQDNAVDRFAEAWSATAFFVAGLAIGGSCQPSSFAILR